MKHVKKSILLWYSPREMYDLVVGVRDYPRFLPWCERAEVIEETKDAMTARLHLAYHGLRHAFTTRNTHVTAQSVTVALVDGPFSMLQGQWQFMPLGTPAATVEGGAAGAGASACKIEFDLAYAFSTPALEAVVSPVFDRIANTFVDAFVSQAERVYGPR